MHKKEVIRREIIKVKVLPVLRLRYKENLLNSIFSKMPLAKKNEINSAFAAVHIIKLVI